MKSRLAATGILLGIFLSSCVCPVRQKPPADIQAAATAPDEPVPLPLKEYIAQAAWDEAQVFSLPQPAEFSLENGLKVLVIERHDLPMVYLHAQIRGGSIYDPPGKEGLAYVTGWALTEGTESYPSRVIDAAMDEKGAIVTSEAYNESCIATLTCLSADLDSLFPYYSEILCRPAFPENEVAESVSYIKGTLLQSKNDLGDLVYRRFRKDVFGDHPYGKPQKGMISSLDRISRQDVLDFYREFYRPDRAVLVFTGDVTPVQAERLARQYLAGWEHSEKPLPAVEAPGPVTGRHVFLVDKPAVQAQIVMGHIGIDKQNPDQFALQLLTEILGGGLESRLSTEVRVKRGLTYSIYAFFAAREFTGEFAVVTFTKAGTVGEAIRVILSELERIRTEPVSEQELRDAKQSLIGQFPLAFEQYEGIAREWIHSRFYQLPESFVTQYASYIMKTTAADIEKAADRYIHPGDLVITVVGPKEELLPQLQEFGNVRIVPEI